MDYCILSINLINSLIWKFQKVTDADMLEILTDNIDFLLAKKR